MNFEKKGPLKGEITIPGDKSISHRSIMFGSLAQGKTEITHFLNGADCISTMNAFRQLGIDIVESDGTITVNGKGLHGLKASDSILNMGNSGTTTRLISGILSGQNFSSILTGDASICKRPMKRIMEPLSLMGAQIHSMNGNGCAPLQIFGSPLSGITYKTPVASAQVKSSILLAGLYAEGKTTVTEPSLSRDHTEIMLRSFGADIVSEGTTVTITPEPTLIGQKIVVPGDISSAAYFIAAGLIVPGSEILIKNVGVNKTRAGIIEVAKQMGGDITLLNANTNGEPTADLLVRHSSLHGITIEGDIIPTLIDELPVIAIMAAAADGTTIIKDAAELKVKESNRIDTVVTNLQLMGGNVEPQEDGMIIHGGCPLHGAEIESYLDHRIAMSFAVASLVCDGVLTINKAECVDISYPTFYNDLFSLC